jgi:Zn-dependent oligopeptidase
MHDCGADAACQHPANTIAHCQCGQAFQQHHTTLLLAASSCRNIEFDAAETVSMMQEKWAWDKSTFLSFARHYQTGEQLSKEVYDNMMQMRRFGQGAQ